MSTIWKYPLAMRDDVTIVMPRAAQVLAVDVQFGRPQLWALVDPDGEPETRHFAVVGTGNPCGLSSTDYIGSVQLDGGAFVFHVFEARPR
jgi:hypothetical protein